MKLKANSSNSGKVLASNVEDNPEPSLNNKEGATTRILFVPSSEGKWGASLIEMVI